MSDFKSYMVKARSIGGGWALLVGTNGAGVQVPDHMLHPIPAMMTKQERVVVEAAQKWRDVILLDFIHHPLTVDLVAAIDVLRASRKPADPVAEVKAAWNAFETARTADANGDALRRLRAAIAALEAKS